MELTDLELGYGRRIRLTNAHVARAYARVLEGYPCAKVNDWELRALQDMAARLFPNQPCHVRLFEAVGRGRSNHRPTAKEREGMRARMSYHAAMETRLVDVARDCLGAEEGAGG